MEIASNKSSSEELLNILSKFTEIPDKVKLVQLSHLMYKSEKPKKERGEEFKTLLTSLPIDLVKICHALHKDLKEFFLLRYFQIVSHDTFLPTNNHLEILLIHV